MKKYLSDYPHLVDEYHLTKNKKLPSEVSHKSVDKVWWVCKLGHEYDSAVCSRTSGIGCPVCNDKRVLTGYNDMWTTNVSLSERLVNPLVGYRYTESSMVKAHFWCGNGLQHYFETSISSACNGVICSVCRGKTVWEGFNDLWTTHPDHAVYLLDQTDGYKYTSGSSVKLWWVCPNNHLTYRSVYSMSLIKGEKCRRCLMIDIRYPAYVAELLNPELAPNTLAGSGEKIWWKCLDNPKHRYFISPNQRFGRKGTITGCPHCSNQISECEKELIYTIPHEVETQLKFKGTFDGRIRNFTPDIYIPEYNLIIEYDGVNWHNKPETVLWDTQKTIYLLDKGYKVVRFREYKTVSESLPDLPIVHQNFLQIHGKYSVSRKHVYKIWPQIESWLDENPSN